MTDEQPGQQAAIVDAEDGIVGRGVRLNRAVSPLSRRLDRLFYQKVDEEEAEFQSGRTFLIDVWNF